MYCNTIYCHILHADQVVILVLIRLTEAAYLARALSSQGSDMAKYSFTHFADHKRAAMSVKEEKKRGIMGVVGRRIFSSWLPCILMISHYPYTPARCR